MKLTEGERADRIFERRSKSKAHWSEFAIAEQDRREGPLVEALWRIAEARTCIRSECDCMYCIALKAIAAWEALDAKPEPDIINLRGAVDEIERECPGRVVAVLKDSPAWRVIQVAARGKATVDATPHSAAGALGCSCFTDTTLPVPAFRVCKACESKRSLAAQKVKP